MTFNTDAANQGEGVNNPSLPASPLSVLSCRRHFPLRAGESVLAIRIYRGKRLAEEPGSGHNRYHPDIAPIEEIALETRDTLDGQIGASTTIADFPALEVGAVHPLTGPVFVKGAMPGDLLEIEFADIIAQPTGFSAIMPGLGGDAVGGEITGMDGTRAARH